MAPIQLSRTVLAALAVAAILFAIPAGKPLYLDNVDFPAVAKATAQTGLPVYYHGEENPRHSGLFHPPLYIYLLAAWFRLWGFGAAQARLFGFLLLIVHGWLALRVVRVLFGTTAARQATPWFWVVFLLNPFALQGAAVLDIDTTIYGPLLTAMLLAALRLRWRDGQLREDAPGPAEFVLLAAMTTAALWAKLTTVLAVMPATVLLAAGGPGGRKMLVRSAAAVASGAVVFLGSYAVFSWWTGLDGTYTFRFTFMSFESRVHTGGLPARILAHSRIFLDMATWQVLWSGLLPWGAALTVTAWAGWKAARSSDRRWRDVGIVMALALAVSGGYCALLYSFGHAPFKYVFVFWGLVAACLSLLASVAAERIKAQRKIPRMACTLLLSALFIASFMVSARLLRDRAILGENTTLAEKWIFLAPVLLVGAGFLFRESRAAPCLAVAGVLLHSGHMTGTALAMARAPYPTTYDYGQLGFEETACFLRENTTPEERIVSMKDIGFHVGRKYYENYAYVFSGQQGADAMRAIFQAGKARFAVFTEGNGPDDLRLNPPLQRVVRDYCTLVRSYGHYRIYDCARKAQQDSGSGALRQPAD